MLVYRVELPDGTGPWCEANGKWHAYVNTKPEYRGLQGWSNPCSIDWEIQSKFQKDPNGTWRFGFTTWKQFFEYCLGGRAVYEYSRQEKERSLKVIKERGMSISVYDVPDLAVMKDSTQCVFRIAEATLVERLDSLSDQVAEQLSIYLGDTKKARDEKEAGDKSW